MSPRSASACVERGAVKGEGERDLAALPFGLDRGVELIEEAHPALAAEAHDVADREPLARLHQRVPARAVEPFDQRCRDRRFAIASADAAAVELAAITLVSLTTSASPGRSKSGRSRTVRSRAPPRAGMHHQQPRGIAR